MRTIAAALFVITAIVPSLANDTAAQLTTGGLEFVNHEQIVMQSEDLFISAEEIRVTYVFRNDGDTDETLLVAFPMPDIVPEFFAPVAFPSGPDDNLFEFHTTFDGDQIPATLHETAFAVGVDRTKLLKQLDLPLVPIGVAAGEAVAGLDEAARAELLKLGMLIPDMFDAGEGWTTEYYPGWTYRATYTWEATFPAGETVTVEHSYKPSVGGTVGTSILSEPTEDYDPIADYAQKFCVDDSFVAAVRKRQINPDEPWSVPYTESWISYILTTGGNWAGGAIETFRLVIDKGSEDNLVSFCGEGVTKIGPTTFEMTATDFWPEKELDILILNHHPEMFE